MCATAVASTLPRLVSKVLSGFVVILFILHNEPLFHWDLYCLSEGSIDPFWGLQKPPALPVEVPRKKLQLQASSEARC